MNDTMLSISEAAKLMDVCENTLRDWDIEGTFKAERTSGNHRRYSLDQIREYLEKNPPKEKAPVINTRENIVRDLTEKWEKYLTDLNSIKEKGCLAVLLENAYLYSEVCTDLVFTTDQILWLTQQVWLRSKFKKMVSVQPFSQPCGLVYYVERTLNKRNEINLKNAKCYAKAFCNSEAVAAKTTSYNTYLFPKANYEVIKDIYADELADKLDLIIASHLPKINIEPLLDAFELNENLSNIYDYILTTKESIKILKNNELYRNIDFYEIPVMVDEDGFNLVSYAGQYPSGVNNIKYSTICNSNRPCVFSPYILLSISVKNEFLLRSGWFIGKESEERRNE